MLKTNGLGPWIKSHRESAGLTAVKLGEKVGVSFVTVLNAEHGAHVSVRTLKKLSRFFGTTLSTLRALNAPPVSAGVTRNADN